MNFMSIVLVFMLAYGVGRDVILNPDTDRSFSTFVGRLFVPYFQMYGELFIEYPQESSKFFDNSLTITLEFAFYIARTFY